MVLAAAAAANDEDTDDDEPPLPTPLPFTFSRDMLTLDRSNDTRLDESGDEEDSGDAPDEVGVFTLNKLLFVW
ncbi:hypothetical protein D3C80_1944510 [compost metagenome]